MLSLLVDLILGHPILSSVGSVVALAIGTILYPYVAFYKYRKALSKLPGPPQHGFFLGNLPDIPKETHLQLANMVAMTHEYGDHDMFAFQLGPFPQMTVVGPSAAKEILASSRHTLKSPLYNFFFPWLGTGLLTSHGEKWKSRRKMITPAFHFDVLQRFLEVMNEQTDVLVERMKEESAKSNENGKFEVFELITACALDIICETAMGKKVHAQSSTVKLKYVDAVYEMSKCITYRIQHPLAINDFIYSFLPNGRIHASCLKELHSFTRQVIRERKQLWEEEEKKGVSAEDFGKKRRLAFLDMLLKADVDGQPLTDEDIRQEVDTFMFEGHDTTSASLAWTLHLLGAYPEVQKRLQEEVDEVMGDEKDLSMEMLGKLRYLDMVLKESLRLYPSVPMIGRTTTEEVVINGFTIPEGTQVNLNIAAMHRNNRYWDRSTEFVPERWEGDKEEKNPYVYIPFSAGPRNCIGQKFAHNEEKVIISKIMRKFTLTACEREPHTFPEVILRPTKGIWLTLQERK